MAPMAFLMLTGVMWCSWLYSICTCRRQTVEHPFGTLKTWMGYTHFLTRTLPRVRTELSLHVLAYNLKRMMNILGNTALLEGMRT